MSKKSLSLALAFSCVLVVGGRSARAEIVATDTGPSYSGALIRSGLATFGVGYVAALAVAATSSHAGDNRLYVPVLGPWLDLGSRGSCPVGNAGCDHETINKVLLVGDGVIQAAGVITMLTGLLTPSHTIVATKHFTLAQVLPTTFAGGSPGLSAVGRF